MNYQEKAYCIIKESIKSAVFIDEKARFFFQPEAELKGENEEQLSVNLYKNFMENGISLSIHKFKKGEENNNDIKKFLFANRDLVLLDWKLDGDQGEDLSLQLLSDIVKAPHINFCAIYTSQADITEIYLNILAYFSGKNAEFYFNLKTEFEAQENELKPILSRYSLTDNQANGKLLKELAAIEEGFIDKIKDATSEKNFVIALKYLFIAFNKLNYSTIELEQPEIFTPVNKTLVINNTLIAILQKETDNDVSELIKKLSSQFSKSKNSYTQLLGLEMQSIFANQGAFIDSNLLKVSLEALLEHRKLILKKNSSDIPFKALIKKVLIEHASMSLRTAKLALLEDTFLDEESEKITSIPSNESLSAMNVFYNSVKLENSILGEPPTLNFGDVFDNGKGDFYICITALCDCYLPSKIHFNFYFAKGCEINKDLALTLGDTAFISFLPNSKVISWIAPESDRAEYNEESIDDLKSAIEEFKKYKYQPVYVKPLVYNVKSNIFTDGEIEIRRVETKNDDGGDLDFITLKYVTTIRSNYTQRIANHAFAHPVRVGIDFVKK